MPGPRPNPCMFPVDFLQEARNSLRRRTVAVRTVQRFQLVLMLQHHPLLSNQEAGKVVGLSARQVQRWRSRCVAGDFSVDNRPGRGRKATLSPSGSRVDSSDRL
jgi:hypothetical protein